MLHAGLAALRGAQQRANDGLLGWSAAQSDATLGEAVQFRFVFPPLPQTSM